MIQKDKMENFLIGYKIRYDNINFNGECQMTTNRSMGLLDKAKEEANKKMVQSTISSYNIQVKKKCVMRFLLFMIFTISWKIQRYVVGD